MGRTLFSEFFEYLLNFEDIAVRIREGGCIRKLQLLGAKVKFPDRLFDFPTIPFDLCKSPAYVLNIKVQSQRPPLPECRAFVSGMQREADIAYLKFGPRRVAFSSVESLKFEAENFLIEFEAAVKVANEENDGS